jgi:hypothetical protein
MLRTVQANTASTWNAFWQGGPLDGHSQANASPPGTSASSVTPMNNHATRIIASNMNETRTDRTLTKPRPTVANVSSSQRLGLA